MDAIDELRVFSLPQYEKATNADLGKLVGRSARYVEQRRAILALPETILEHIWAGDIRVDQAAGLTYFIADEEALIEAADDCMNNPRVTGDDLRAEFERQCKSWDKAAMTKLVTREEYIDAGGKLQADLFDDEAFILSPGVLKALAEEKAEAKLREDYPNAAFFICDESGFYTHQQHRGLDKLTPEEAEEWESVRWETYRHAEDEEPEWFARYGELKEKATPFFTPELEAMLGVVWKVTNWGDNPIETRKHVLPDDLEPLYEAGFLERPKPAEAAEGATPQEPEDEISNALSMRIARMKAHCQRMDLASSPDKVIAHYTADLVSNGYAFDARPEGHNQLDDPEQGQFSAGWEKMLALETNCPKTVLSMKPADNRRLLAKRMLDCLTVQAKIVEIDGPMLRKYLALDEGFFKAYKAPQLAKMIAEVTGRDAAIMAGSKKAGLVAEAAKLFCDQDNWLPLGF